MPGRGLRGLVGQGEDSELPGCVALSARPPPCLRCGRCGGAGLVGVSDCRLFCWRGGACCCDGRTPPPVDGNNSTCSASVAVVLRVGGVSRAAFLHPGPYQVLVLRPGPCQVLVLQPGSRCLSSGWPVPGACPQARPVPGACPPARPVPGACPQVWFVPGACPPARSAGRGCPQDLSRSGVPLWCPQGRHAPVPCRRTVCPLARPAQTCRNAGHAITPVPRRHGASR